MAVEQELATIKKPKDKPEKVTKAEYERRILEIAKCKRDIIYFAEKYYRIINLDKGLHVIKLYDIQKELLKFLVDNNKVIVCSGRQQGKSTIYCIYTLWLTCFFPEKKVLILANKASTALELVQRIITGYEYLPSWLKPACTVLNKGEISFANMSSIKGYASSSDAARGSSGNVVIMDEFAFLQKNIADKVFTSMYPVISSSMNGKFIIVSTPNGVDNLYYDIWQKAHSKNVNENQDGWKPFTMYWWQVPGHDEKWKEEQIAAIGPTRFAQEFNNEFLANSATRKLIPDDILERYRIDLSEKKAKGLLKGKELKIFSEHNDSFYVFKMWHEFRPNRTYLASGDIAEGIGGDSSVLYVWDITNLDNITMCAKFSSTQVSTIEFAYIVKNILKLYNNPWFVAERNGISGGMLESLHITYQYENIVTEGKNGELGVYSHIQNKSKSCLWARDMLTTNGFGFTFYDVDLIDEMGTFAKKNNKGINLVYSAMSGAHDDHIMSFIWMTYILQPEIIERYYIVCDTFTNLGNIYPKVVLPLREYKEEDVQEITNDKTYQEFLEFKSDLVSKLGEKYKEEMELQYQLNKRGGFGYDFDPYFGEIPYQQPINSQMNGNDYMNPSNRPPVFFV